jgi:hypothetical protein
MTIKQLPEPVVIDFDQQHWHHPNIESMLSWEVNGHNPGQWSYDNLYRIYLENAQKQTACIVIYWPGVPWEDVVEQDLGNIIPVILFEDVWMPGVEQFCFTDAGQKLFEKFGESAITFSSPDVGIQAIDGEYHWSS